MKKFFTSESVCSGHPDKVCDRISDAILDEYLKQDPASRVACECAATSNFLLIMGEITSRAKVDASEVARRVIKETGYDYFGSAFSSDNVEIVVKINKQSPDIALGVDNSLEAKENGKDRFDKIGAGDQGLMFGYAVRETAELMPLPVILAHRMCKKLEDVRKAGELKYLKPDGKGQITVEYDNGIPKRIDTVVLSAQHDDKVMAETLRKDLKAYVIDAVLPKEYVDDNTKFYINPTGRFEVGGPEGDSGLTGRKIIVDTYGGKAPHGGGSLCYRRRSPRLCNGKHFRHGKTFG